MLKSLADSTIVQYNVTYKLWWEYCKNNQFSPLDGDIKKVILFFQHLLQTTKNIFGSFNSHRAALSLILPGNVGDNADLKRFLKGVFRLRPSRPRYDSVWDPQQVLTFLRKSEDSDLKSLTTKLITLLALATGQRIQTLSLIRCANIQELDSGLKIFIPDLIKTSGPYKKQPSLNLPYFRDDPKLCVATTIKKYLNITMDLRQDNCDNLFLTYKRPHGSASKQSLSRWVKNTLKAAGVNTNIFKSHSTRHASTSAALRRGVSVDVIKNSAGWSKDSSTFAKFYNRPLTEPQNLLEAVFKLDN